MFNSIRRNIYISAYFNLINKYNKEFRAIQSTYYLFDDINSVYDKDVLRYGAYERIGSLSGYKWIKILYFPIALSTETHPNTQQSQYGVTTVNETIAVFPYINFRPNMLDFINPTIDGQSVHNVFQVSAIEEAYIGDESTSKIFKVTLKQQWFENIDSQVERELCYSEIFDKIYEVDIFNKQIETFTYLTKLCTKVARQEEQTSGLIIQE